MISAVVVCGTSHPPCLGWPRRAAPMRVAVTVGVGVWSQRWLLRTRLCESAEVRHQMYWMSAPGLLRLSCSVCCAVRRRGRVQGRAR